MMALTRRQWLLMGVLTLLWGLNWPMMKFTLREVSPLYFRALTMSGGTLTLIAFFAWRGVPLGVSRADAVRLAWLALPNIIGWHLCSIIGLAQLPSGRAAVLAFTMPVWTVLLSVLFFGERMSARSWLAVVAAITAVGLLASNELTALAGRPVGLLWLQAAALSWALGTVLMRRSTLALPTEAVTTWMMVFGSLFFWVTAPLVEPWPVWGQWHAPTWWAMGYGVFLNFGFAQLIWFGLARSLPAQASAFSVMAVPLVGIATATAVVGEVPRATDWLAALCIAVALASATGQAARPATQRQSAAMNRRPRLALVAALDRRRAIGRDGALLWHETEDQKHFRAVTMGCPVIMGRKTWDSLPPKFRPLPGRRNIVVTRNAQWLADGAETAPSLDTALAMASGAAKAFVIGGGELYAQAIAHADELVLTEVDTVFDRADVHFPPFDGAGFVESSREEHRGADATRFAFVTYRRKP